MLIASLPPSSAMKAWWLGRPVAGAGRDARGIMLTPTFGTVWGTGNVTAVLNSHVCRSLLLHTPTRHPDPLPCLASQHDPGPQQSVLLARFHSEPNTQTVSLASTSPVWSTMPEKKKNPSELLGQDNCSPVLPSNTQKWLDLLTLSLMREETRYSLPWNWCKTRQIDENGGIQDKC